MNTPKQHLDKDQTWLVKQTRGARLIGLFTKQRESRTLIGLCFFEPDLLQATKGIGINPGDGVGIEGESLQGVHPFERACREGRDVVVVQREETRVPQVLDRLRGDVVNPVLRQFQDLQLGRQCRHGVFLQHRQVRVRHDQVPNVETCKIGEIWD